MKPRYVFRVMVQGEPGEWIPVRHYQTLTAARYCACIRSKREGRTFRVERSEAVDFDTIHVAGYYANGVAL